MRPPQQEAAPSAICNGIGHPRFERRQRARRQPERRAEGHAPGRTRRPAGASGLPPGLHQLSGWKGDRVRGDAQQHSSIKHAISPDSNLPKPNPLKPGSPVEPNGTMIIDVTDPKNPVEKFHIPGPIAERRSPDAIQPHVPGFRPAGRHSGQRLHDAQRPGQAISPSPGMRSGTSPMSPTRRSSARYATFAIRTSIGGSARPVSLTCRAAKARRHRNGARASRWSSSIGAIPRRTDLPPHSRVAGRTTEWNRTCAAFAAWSDLRARASQCGGQAGARRLPSRTT